MNSMEQTEVVAILKQILKWTRLQAVPSVKATLENILAKPEYRRLYQTLDGTKKQSEIAKGAGFSQARVSQLVGTWLKAGIVDEISPNRYAKSFDLEELGIEITPQGE